MKRPVTRKEPHDLTATVLTHDAATRGWVWHAAAPRRPAFTCLLVQHSRRAVSSVDCARSANPSPDALRGRRVLDAGAVGSMPASTVRRSAGPVSGRAGRKTGDYSGLKQ